MLTYLKMKRNERKLKAMFYEFLVSVIDNQKDLLALIQKLFIALKDVPVEELQKEFINRLAEIIHAENRDKTNP